MGNLHRTQIYIEEDQMHQLKLEAEREHLAVSKLIRHAIDRLLKTRANNIDWDRDPLTKAIGKIKLTVTNAAVDHDHYLYGRRKRR